MPLVRLAVGKPRMVSWSVSCGSSRASADGVEVPESISSDTAGRGLREYTQSMTTTIKVSDELRDRLKAQAARDSLTLGAHLARLADADDRRHRLLALQMAVAETSTEGMESYAAESLAWERSELTDATA